MPSIKDFFSKIYALTINKLFIFFAGIGLVTILLVFSLNWVGTPDYAPLFSSLSSQDEKNVVKLLDANGIHYKLSPTSGMILVAGTGLNRARMLMAQNGLPSTTQDAYSLLTKNEGIYTSQTNEEIIKRRILEENIQSAIETINGVESAKVQLALPNHTDFMQDIIRPTASIVVHLQPGVTLGSDQVQGIAYLVASGIPYMKPADVTIVDQTGDLLSTVDSSTASFSTDELKYRQDLESKLSQQILNVLAPIVGRDNVRVQVNANVDFNVKENTTKSYLPDKRSVQSEQVEKSSERNMPSGAQGVPGSLSNQPPKSGKLNEQASGGGGGAPPATQGATESTNDRETYNYSLGESVTHTNFSKGDLKDLSVAIVLNDRKVLVPKPAGGKEGDKKDAKKTTETVEYQPWKAEEIQQLTLLAKNAIGFNEYRGDKISVVNARFFTDETAKPAAPFTPPFYSQHWFLEITKGLLFLIGFIVFVLFIWRPFYQYLFSSVGKALVPAFPEPAAAMAGAGSEVVSVKTEVNDLESTLQNAKTIFEKSPDLAAGVIKKWVRSTDHHLE